MKHLSEETVHRVMEGLDIIEVISEFVVLEKAGKEFRGLCPFHSEKTPSFNVSPAKQLFYCFGCGAGGDILSFLMKYEKCSFVEAVEFLAKRQGIPLMEGNGFCLDGSKNKKKEVIIKINEIAAHYYHDLLMKTGGGKVAQKYLSSREVASETVKEFCLGWSKDSWKDLLFFLKRKSISPAEAAEAGLVSFRQDRNEGYDRFRGRIIFPIYNHDGRVIALGGRKIDDGSNGPKYLNSSETPVYSKSKSLYGLYQAKQFIRQCGFALMVEGYLDFLSLYQRGLKNTVATLGTSLTQEQVKLLGRYTKKVIFIYDADQAGISATLRGLDIFQQQNIEVKVVTLPSGHDPDSFIREYGPEELSKRIEQSISAIEFFINQSIQAGDISTIEGKIRTTKEILVILSKVFDPLVRMEYVKLVARRLDIREEMILDELRRKSGVVQTSFLGNSNDGRADLSVPDAVQVAERILIGLICRGDISMEDVIDNSMTENDFQSPLMKQIAETIFFLWQKRGRFTTEELIFALKDEKLKGTISSFLFEEGDGVDINKIFRDCVVKIKGRELIKRFHVLQNEIKSMSHDNPRLNELLKEYTEIKKKL